MLSKGSWLGRSFYSDNTLPSDVLKRTDVVTLEKITNNNKRGVARTHVTAHLIDVSADITLLDAE